MKVYLNIFVFLFVVQIYCAESVMAQCPSAGCTITIAGPDASPYTVNAGQKLCLTATANFTGTITMNGGILENCATATQTFTLLFNNGPQSTFNNYGSFTSPPTLSINDGDVYNYGTITVLGPNNLNINGDSRFYNYDSINVANNLKTASTAYLFNEGIIITGNQFHQNGSSLIENVGTIIGGDVKLSYDFYNAGSVTATINFQTNGTGTITIDGGCFNVPSWINNKPINGINCGTIFISGYSENNDTITGTVAIVDATPPGAPPYVDVNTGLFGPGVQWTSCGCPGSLPIIENCYNAIDDDGDGFIDSLDSDCFQYNTCFQIKVDPSKVSGSNNLQNFPMLVDVTDPALRNTSNGGAMENSNGYDIRFKIGCSQILYHQIENYDESAGRMIVWVQVPVLYASDTTLIEMEVGNSTISSNTSSTSVWSYNYEAVWHLNNSFSDATSNGINGTNNGSTNLAGQMSQGRDFDGTNDYVGIGNTAMLRNKSQASLSVWVNPDIIMPDGHMLAVGTGGAANGSSRAQLSLVNNLPEIGARSNDGEAFYTTRSTNAIGTGSWYHIVGTINYATDQTKVFINGVQQPVTTAANGVPGPITFSQPTTSNTNSANAAIGADDDGVWYFSDGTLDEPRVIDKVLSPDWILTEYNNQSSPATFYTTSTCTCFATAPTEDCGNGTDDNFDGFIDEYDLTCDLDGDGILNKDDQDDDNDGINDLDESDCNTAWLQLVAWKANILPVDAPVDLDPVHINSAANLVFGSGIGGSIVATHFELTGVDQPDLNAAIADNDYIEFAFTTNAGINGLYLQAMLQNKHPASTGVLPENYGYDISIRFSNNGFISSHNVVEHFHIDSIIPPTWTSDVIHEDPTYYFFEEGKTYTTRVYFFNKIIPAATAWFDDFDIYGSTCKYPLDVDNDGIPNHMDLNSDNDFCSDVVEAGFTDHNNDSILGDSPVTVDSVGLVTSGVDGYTSPDTSFLYNSLLGCIEICNDSIDNDGDGLVDCNDSTDCVPDMPGIITASNDTICSGVSGESYSISAVAGATSYDWTVPAGATITAGQGTISISVDWGSTSGNVCVRSYNGFCYSSFSCKAIIVNNPPSNPAGISHGSP